MLGISRFCVNNATKFIHSNISNGFQCNRVFAQSNQASRQLFTLNNKTLKCNNSVKAYFSHSCRSRLQYKISQSLKNTSLMIARNVATNDATKKQTSKAVGYWLLTCSGMVFVAVVLGTITGYFVLLYSIYYVLDLILYNTKHK